MHLDLTVIDKCLPNGDDQLLQHMKMEYGQKSRVYRLLPRYLIVSCKYSVLYDNQELQHMTNGVRTEESGVSAIAPLSTNNLQRLSESETREDAACDNGVWPEESAVLTSAPLSTSNLQILSKC